MVEEIIKNARVTSAGRRILSSIQKASIVEDWESTGLSCPEFCRRYGLIASQLYKWRSDAKTGAVMSIKNDGELINKRYIYIALSVLNDFRRLCHLDT